MKKLLILLLFLAPILAWAEYTEEVVTSKVEVLEAGQIQFYQITKILKDGVEIAEVKTPLALMPGDSLEGKEERIKSIANAVWTEKVIADYEKIIEDSEKEREKLIKDN